MVRCMYCGGHFDGDGACGDGVCAACGRLSSNDRSRIAALVTERDEALTAHSELLQLQQRHHEERDHYRERVVVLDVAKAELVAVLRDYVEFSGEQDYSGEPICLVCTESIDNGHAEPCPVAAVLAKHGGR